MEHSSEEKGSADCEPTAVVWLCCTHRSSGTGWRTSLQETPPRRLVGGPAVPVAAESNTSTVLVGTRSSPSAFFPVRCPSSDFPSFPYVAPRTYSSCPLPATVVWKRYLCNRTESSSTDMTTLKKKSPVICFIPSASSTEPCYCSQVANLQVGPGVLTDYGDKFPLEKMAASKGRPYGIS